MDRDFWIERWMSNQIGFHQDRVNPALVRCWQGLNARGTARVFVPLCGKSHDMHWLRQQGYRVIGCELSPLAVKAFFTEYGPAPEIRPGERFTSWEQDDIEILCGDFFQLTPADVDPVDAFYDRASLIALTPQQRPVYAQRLAELVRQDTPGLLITLDYNQHEMDGPPFAVSAAEVERLFGNNFEIEPVFSVEVLDENRRFREKGLTGLSEHIYSLKRR